VGGEQKYGDSLVARCKAMKKHTKAKPSIFTQQKNPKDDEVRVSVYHNDNTHGLFYIKKYKSTKCSTAITMS